MLTNKEKSYLRGLAQTKRALFQIGKDGITPNMIRTVSDSLEAHELPFLSATIKDFQGIIELLETLPE